MRGGDGRRSERPTRKKADAEPPPEPEAAPGPDSGPDPEAEAEPERGSRPGTGVWENEEDLLALVALVTPLTPVTSATVPTRPETPARAFDALYAQHAPALSRQAFLLCGHRRMADRAVAAAFHLAWERWPEVAVDPDPGGWVRAAMYTYALSPWRRLRPRRRHRDTRRAPASDRALLEALLALPPSYRAALLLHDGLGVGLSAIAAETEASTPATAGRLEHARDAVLERMPELRDEPGAPRGVLLSARLRELAAAQPARTRPARLVRRGGERRTQRRHGAAVGLTVTVAVFTGAALWNGSDGADRPADDKARGQAVGSTRFAPSAGPPDSSGSGSGAGADQHARGTEERHPSGGERKAKDAVLGIVQPLPGAAPETSGSAYAPQLRSVNRRMHMDDFTPDGELKRDQPRTEEVAREREREEAREREKKRERAQQREREKALRKAARAAKTTKTREAGKTSGPGLFQGRFPGPVRAAVAGSRHADGPAPR
ncbi:RNA polymerase sigma factor [Streptomyces daliensis]|uniref:DNA-directed RNA polymerase specialized sigma subunit, sigma24 family n=1 Tax=Streptomyces daliensis TaxID=299421 RepID=A0A8T4IZA0_9ACTN|nr:hypothetical protein [Streptomyces daliensis]